MSNHLNKLRLSPQQLAIANEKRLARQAKKLNQQGNTEDANRNPQHLARPWVSLFKPMDAEAYVVKVMTWNVRRSLFMTRIFQVFTPFHICRYLRNVSSVR